MKSKYEGDFESRNDVEERTQGYDVPAEDDIIFAGYENGGYDGHALIVFWKDGKVYQNDDWHCSCHGLEDWSPEETTLDAVAMQTGWDGLSEAVERARQSGK